MTKAFEVVDTYLAKAASRLGVVILHPEDFRIWQREAPYLTVSTDPAERRPLTYLNVPVEVREDVPRAAEALAQLENHLSVQPPRPKNWITRREQRDADLEFQTGVLRKAEWAGTGPEGAGYCPLCGGFNPAQGGKGHLEDCMMREALAD